ncbi:co-chaperone DjlA [Thalassotalea sp. PLHSN55]|uniref:co-chaperone DjlA n=1 Tax=Thalassotalea sp. PLHSN55 TaxID=3435888 RepID=UPI003F82B03B
MRIWGKVLGFLFGFMLSRNIFGALLGLWLGHRFDQGMGFNFSNLAGPKSEADRQAAFFYSTFSVMGHVAKAKGHVSSHEIAFATAYMDKLGLNAQLRQQAQDAFREGKMAGFPINDCLAKFKRSCAGRPDILLLFLEIQIQVAFADGDLDAEEHDALRNIAKQLGFSVKELDNLLEMIMAGASFHQGQAGQTVNKGKQLEDAYKVLGVSKDASKAEIKKAYRKLMAQHHPDKLIAKGLPPEMMEVAKEKTQDIQAAYDLIAKQG